MNSYDRIYSLLTEAAKGTGKTRKFKSGEYQGNTFSALRPQGKRRTSTDTDETDTGRQGPKLPTRLQAKLGAMKKSREDRERRTKISSERHGARLRARRQR